MIYVSVCVCVCVCVYVDGQWTAGQLWSVTWNDVLRTGHEPSPSVMFNDVSAMIINILRKSYSTFDKHFHNRAINSSKLSGLGRMTMQLSLLFFYPHMPICKVWIYRSLSVCLFCNFVRLRIFPARINVAASNFARQFIGVLGRESPILGNFAPPEAENRKNRRAASGQPSVPFTGSTCFCMS